VVLSDVVRNLLDAAKRLDEATGAPSGIYRIEVTGEMLDRLRSLASPAPTPPGIGARDPWTERFPDELEALVMATWLVLGDWKSGSRDDAFAKARLRWLVRKVRPDRPCVAVSEEMAKRAAREFAGQMGEPLLDEKWDRDDELRAEWVAILEAGLCHPVATPAPAPEVPLVVESDDAVDHGGGLSR
jgi:hypothetical protein